MKLKKTKYIILLLLLVLLSTSFAAVNPMYNYCSGQGYKIKEQNGTTYCVFNDNEMCEAWQYYKGTCGAEYHKEQKCRMLGENVQTEYEKCCFNAIPYLKRGYVGQQKCVLPIKIYGFPVFIFSTILFIAYIIYKRVKKNKK